MVESFAAIVSLIGQFRSERGSASQVEFNDFIEWLVTTNHKDVVRLLDLNANAAISIKAMLKQDHERFKQQLDRIDAAVSAFSSTAEGFGDLAKSLRPDSVLSDQALSILRQIEESGVTKVLELHAAGGTIYIFLEASGNLEIGEPRFVEDDFGTLVELGLLRQDYNSRGDNVYVFTRAASSLISSQNP